MLDASAHLWLLVKFLQNYCIKHDKSSANDLLMLSVLSLLSSSRAQFLLFALVSLDLAPHNSHTQLHISLSDVRCACSGTF